MCVWFILRYQQTKITTVMRSKESNHNSIRYVSFLNVNINC